MVLDPVPSVVRIAGADQRDFARPATPVAVAVVIVAEIVATVVSGCGFVCVTGDFRLA
jgi:hypothetical protein